MGVLDMKVVCAWCNAAIHDGVANDDDYEGVSHGLCDACLPIVAEDMGVSMDEFLDSLTPPTIVVDLSRRVVAANSTAMALMGKERADFMGQLGGYALGCIHADEPGGCGQMVHCKSCTIKNTVMHTITTGEPLTNVPASAELSVLTGKRTVEFLVSTQRVGDFVAVTLRDAQGDGKTATPADAAVGQIH